MAKITPEELVQDIKEHLQEDYSFDPPRVPRFFTSNIIGRVFAHLVGRASTAPKMLRCTEAGELKTAPTTTGIERNHTLAGTAGDAWSAELSFEETASRLDIFIWDNPAQVSRKLPSGTWDWEFEVPVGFYSIDAVSPGFRIKNKTAGQNSRYQVVGWW